MKQFAENLRRRDISRRTVPSHERRTFLLPDGISG
jgi:hypothetical protein